MNKMAIFVEGQTELLFFEKYMTEVASQEKLILEKRRMESRNKSRRMTLIDAQGTSDHAEYFIMIIDCGSDESVKSDILERHEGLVQNGFRAIIGARDVYPDFARGDVSVLRMGLNRFLRTKPVEVLFILGVMETEAWFLAEHTHLPKVDPALTPERVKKELGFDPAQDDMSCRPHPAEDLDNAYRLVGKTYSKSLAGMQRTMAALDFGRIYLELPGLFEDLLSLADETDRFFTPPGLGNPA